MTLSEFTSLPQVPAAELGPLVAVLSIRQELQEVEGYEEQPGRVQDLRPLPRLEPLKDHHPSLLVEITTTNIVAKNRFKELFESEEMKVVEKTKPCY